MIAVAAVFSEQLFSCDHGDHNKHDDSVKTLAHVSFRKIAAFARLN